MTNLDMIIEKMKQHEGEEFDNKSLAKYFQTTPYYIGKLIDRGVIKRVSKGLYMINELSNNNSLDNKANNQIENGKIYKNNFERFKNFILNGKYESAYNALIECVEEKNYNHEYDNHYRMYFILLTYVLTLKGMANKLNYDYDDKLLEFYDAPRTEYFETYEKFREAVLAKKYDEAYEYLKEYAKCEAARYKENKISTILFQKLLEEIVIMENNKRIFPDKLNKIYELNHMKDYDKLKTALKEAVPIINHHNMKSLCEYMVELCQTVIDFNKDETLILPDKQPYEFSENVSTIGALLYFMRNKDYLNADSYARKYLQIAKGVLPFVAQSLLNNLRTLHINHISLTRPKNDVQEMRRNTNKSDELSKQHYKNVLRSLRELDFDTAYEEMKMCCAFAHNTHSVTYRKFSDLYSLLSFFKDMKENKTILDEVNNIYLTSDSDSFNFHRAIKLKDWHAAQLYLSKFCAKTPLLEAYDLILKNIFLQDKINHETEMLEEVPKLQDSTQTEVAKDVLETVEELLRDETLKEAEATTTEEITLKVELTEEEKHRLDVLESIKDIKLTYDSLYDLIYDQRYEEARYLIEREREQKNYSSRLTFNVHRLITQLQQIHNHIIKEVEQKPIDYSLDNFKIFYAALNNRDYNLALEYVDLCIDITNDKKELVLLKLILQDIVPVYNQEIEEKRQKEEEKRQKEEELGRLYDINNELKNLSYKREFNSDDVNKICSLLKEKVDIANNYDKEHEKDILILGAAEAALMASNKDLNLDCFARIGTDSSKISYSDDTYSANLSTNKTEVKDIFFEALEYGDLITVYSIITTESWDNLRDKMSPVNLRLVKHLLEFINERTPLREISEEELERKKERTRSEKISDEKQKQIDDTIYELLTEEEKDIYRHITFLNSLDSAVEANHFADALDKLLVVEDPFKDTEVISNILLAHNIVKEESQALFDQFLKAEKSNNVEAALKALNNYKAYISEVAGDYNINHLYKRIEILKKDLATRNYSEKEKIFENARSLFNKGQYEKALGLINKYIAMDRYINNKGFVLKGDIYYQMGNYEQAKESYLKAFKLSQNPMVCLNLGKIYFNEENYEEASYYLELYIQMNPFREASVSQMLISCYNSMGQNERTKKYDQHLRYYHI